MFLILLSIVGVVVVIATVTVTQERLSRTCKGGREAASLRASRFPLRIASICVEIRLGEPKARSYFGARSYFAYGAFISPYVVVVRHWNARVSSQLFSKELNWILGKLRESEQQLLGVPLDIKCYLTRELNWILGKLHESDSNF